MCKEILRNAQKQLLKALHCWVTQWAFVGQWRFFCFPELINKGVRKFCVHRVLFSLRNHCSCFNSLCDKFWRSRALFKSAHLLDFKTFIDPIFTFRGRVERRTVATFYPLGLAVPGVGGRIWRQGHKRDVDAHCRRFGLPASTRSPLSWVIMMASFSCIQPKLHTQQSDSARWSRPFFFIKAIAFVSFYKWLGDSFQRQITYFWGTHAPLFKVLGKFLFKFSFPAPSKVSCI